MTPDGIEDAFEVSLWYNMWLPNKQTCTGIGMTIGGLINIIQQKLASKSAHNKS